MGSIYLDYAAATPLDPRVRLMMEPYFDDTFYNPSSPYLAGKEVRRDINDARARVAHWLGARTTEIIFTAGATEATNIAIHGVMRSLTHAKAITIGTEHDSVLESVAQYEHAIAPVLPDGTVDVGALEGLIDDHTVLVSISYANNEIGTIQPLGRIGQLVQHVRMARRQRGVETPIYMHTDASQAAGYLDIHTARLGVDLMTINAAKIYGPKQMAVLYVKAGTQLTASIHGGGQEYGLRSGTENTPGIIGLAAALNIAQQDHKERVARSVALRDELERRLVTGLSDTIVNGGRKHRLPNNLHVSWPGIDGERLVMMLDELGVQASTGSACAANKQTASHVLLACGMADDLVAGSLRLTIGEPTTVGDVIKAAEAIIMCVRDARSAL